MPTPRNKRTIILESSAQEFDRSEFDADGRALRGTGDADTLDAGQAGGPTTDPYWLEGKAAADLLTGSLGNDLLIAFRARLGDEPRDGEADSDNAIGIRTDGRPGTPGDTLVGGGGNDLVFGSDADDLLFGDAPAANPTAPDARAAGDDVLYGFDGDDEIRGGAGDDLVAGGTGANLLDGGAGFDTVSWSYRLPRDVPGNAPGVLLNLSERAFRSGYETREIAVDFLVFPGTAVRPAEQGLDVDSISGFERFEGTALDNDVALLGSGFAAGATGNDGYTAYSDGNVTIYLAGFEAVFFG